MHLLREVEKFLNRSQTAQRGSAAMQSEIRVSYSISEEGENLVQRRCDASAPSWRPSNESHRHVQGRRSIASRPPVPRTLEPDRILLTDYRSTDWQSLTFVGERHEMRFRIPGPDAERAYEAITGDLTDAEFALPRQILADIAVFSASHREPDGSISFGLEALTIAD